MLLQLVASMAGCILAGAAVGLWLHTIDDSLGWSHGEVANVLVCAGFGLLAGLAVGILAAIGAAWAAIALRRHLARGRRPARLVMMGVTLVLWAAGVWMLLLGAQVGAGNWFGWVLMLPALLASLLVVWCGVPWVRRALDRM